MMHPSASALLLGALAASGTMAQNGPPSWMANKLANGPEALNTGYLGGLNGIHSQSYTRTKWAWGTLPETCFKQANEGYCNPYDVEVYDVTYSDCSIPVTLCRCNNSPMSINGFSEAVGRLPVKGRQYAKYFSSFPGNGCSGWSAGYNIGVLGNCASTQSFFFHELTHNLDSAAIGTNGNAYSGLGEWAQIVLKGTCVATGYAKTSWAESYAEVGIMAAYHANVQSLWSMNLNPECMQDQLNKGISQLTPFLKRQAGATCNQYWQKDKSVCMGPAARDAGNCPNNLRIASVSVVDGVTAIEAPVVDQKVAMEDNKRKLAAAKAAGYQTLKNGTLSYTRVGKGNGAAKGFKA